MTKKVMLTTTDNPYNPFKQFNEWLMFDKLNGYHTNERLASITIVSDQLSDKENLDSITSAMDELIKFGVINKEGKAVEYRKIFKEDSPNEKLKY